jgi:TRAP-type C4-dicarboxylate transport system substrate-binding protein
MVRIGRVVVLVAAVAFVLGGCGGSGLDKAGNRSARKPVVLTLAVPFNDPYELFGFDAEVSRLSAGSIRVDVIPRRRSRQSTYENALIGDVRAGRADLGVVGSRAWDSVGLMSFRVLSAPLLIDSYALQERVVRSGLIPPMLSSLSRLGLVGLAVLPGPLRHPLGVARPLLGPLDYAGLRIGVQQSELGSSTVRALGGTPVWVAEQAPIAGLGAVERDITGIEETRSDRVARYLTVNVVLWPRPLVLFANRETLARLTAHERGIVLQAARDATATETQAVVAAERERSADLCRARRLQFVIASPAKLGALRRSVQPIYAMLERDRQTRAEIAQILTMRRGVASEAVPRCRAESASATAPGPLDGVWEMNTKFGDEPADPDQPLSPENYGHWIFVFDRGRFADTQQYRTACTWGDGTFTVKGSQMGWTFTDAGGIGAGNNPGESFRFGWSLYRDTLTVTAVPGAISPLNFYGKPWHRVSTVPSARYLNRRCPPPANALPG